MAVGRPPKYKSADQLQKKIDEYFESGVKKKKVVVGKPSKQEVIEVPIYTISGLCLFLGFESRQAFYHLEKNDEFRYTIKKARLFIENEYEGQLQQGNVAGAIFALKNFGWSDRQDVNVSGNVTIEPKEWVDE